MLSDAKRIKLVPDPSCKAQNDWLSTKRRKMKTCLCSLESEYRQQTDLVVLDQALNKNTALSKNLFLMYCQRHNKLKLDCVIC